MYSKIPFSLENLPRQRNFGCLSLKFGCIFSGLVIILYTILALAQCLATIDKLIPGAVQLKTWESLSMYCFAVVVIICHCVTLVLTSIMLVGTLRDKPELMRPWVIWTSCVVMGNLLLIVFWTAVVTVFNHMDGASLMMFMIAFLGLLIRIYMLMLVTSYYLQLVEEKSERLKTLLTTDTWHNA